MVRKVRSGSSYLKSIDGNYTIVVENDGHYENLEKASDRRQKNWKLILHIHSAGISFDRNTSVGEILQLCNRASKDTVSQGIVRLAMPRERGIRSKRIIIPVRAAALKQQLRNIGFTVVK